MKGKAIVFDATDAVLGRLAARAAKLALEGNSVVIVNCEKAVVVGRPKQILETYKRKRRLGRGTLKGPYFPRTPEKIAKRTVRGMLPYKIPRGKAALRRVLCYEGVPAAYEKSEKTTLKRVIKGRFITLKRLCELL